MKSIKLIYDFFLIVYIWTLRCLAKIWGLILGVLGATREKREGKIQFQVFSPSVPTSKVTTVFGLDRNPPPDHWALVSGLPTYVAQNGLVSNKTFKGESFESGGRVKGFQIKRVGKTMASMDLSKPGSLVSQFA